MRTTNAFAHFIIVGLLVVSSGAPTSAQFGLPNAIDKLDPLLQQRASQSGRSRVIISASGAGSLALLSTLVQLAGGVVGRSLPIINGLAADVPNAVLSLLAGSPLVVHVAMDRVAAGALERTGATVGSTAIRQEFGLDGAGVGVAIIDSGSAATLDDLSDPVVGGTRVDHFVDFVNGRLTSYDDYGHGTHVTGIVGGNGFDSSGRRSGIAPAARLIALKVLDGSGQGRISDVIAALGYAVAQKDAWNIRVVNLSVATGVYESYNLDPLTLAARAAVNAGIVVVAAAGNNGRSPQGSTRYGGTTAPGNAPWVLTVGASSHMGTVDRADDTMAAFSSRGPSALDYAAKPDIVAPGVGIESLSDPNSAFYLTRGSYLLSGTVPTSYLPYLSLSGTSMAAPVVSGTVALMLQANPRLTPNEIKAILEFTAQRYAGYDRLTQGSGFLNAAAAVELAQFLASPPGTPYPSTSGWSTQIIWGNHVIQGGQLTPNANAWSALVTWGDPTTPTGQQITWGTSFHSTGGNVVWGNRCGGADCHTTWTVASNGGAVLGADDGDTVVWGTADGDTVVWGTSADDGDTVVWGTSCTDPSCEPVIWPPE
jgi:serine protease AprX